MTPASTTSGPPDRRGPGRGREEPAGEPISAHAARAAGRRHGFQLSPPVGPTERCRSTAPSCRAAQRRAHRPVLHNGGVATLEQVSTSTAAARLPRGNIANLHPAIDTIGGMDAPGRRSVAFLKSLTTTRPLPEGALRSSQLIIANGVEVPAVGGRRRAGLNPSPRSYPAKRRNPARSNHASSDRAIMGD